MTKNAQQKIIAALSAIFLALTYIFFGYALVSGVAPITETVANATIDEAGSPFTHDQLVEGALAVRDYSFGSHDAEALYDTLARMNDADDTPLAGASREELMDGGDRYTIDQAELAHLDDVNSVASLVFYPLLGCAIMAAFLMMAGLKQYGTRTVALALLWSGCAVLAAMAILGLWAAISFESLFGLMHSMLFAEGTWTFPADSLLITMLPEAFWIGMGGIWLGTSALLAAISIGAGMVFYRSTTTE